MEDRKVILQPSEWILMEKLWANPPRTIMQLFHALREEQGWSKSTVNTMLGRMVQKGIIYYKEGERARAYFPAVARDDAAIVETEGLLKRIYQGSVSMMLNTLIRNRNISDEELQELYHILGEAVNRDD